MLEENTLALLGLKYVYKQGGRQADRLTDVTAVTCALCRFSAEAKAERPQHCYMPFGTGPRNCIGMRFALLEAKMALIEVVKRFTFVRAPDTQVCSRVTSVHCVGINSPPVESSLFDPRIIGSIQ